MIEGESTSPAREPTREPPQRESTREDEELLAACEYALRWFEAWEEHAPDECAFGGEHTVMKRLRRAMHLMHEVA